MISPGGSEINYVGKEVENEIWQIDFYGGNKFNGFV